MKRIAIVLGLAVGALALAFMSSRVASRGRFAPAYSTYGSGPDGTRGLFLLAQELGFAPVRWSEDLARLPPGGMLVAMGGCDAWHSRPLSRYENAALKAWIEEDGGTLLVAGAPDYVPDDMHISLVSNDRDCDPTGGFLGAVFRADREDERRATRGDDPTGEEEARAMLEDDPQAVWDELDEGTPIPKPQWAAGEVMLDGVGGVPLRRPSVVRFDEGGTRILLSMMPMPDWALPKDSYGAFVRVGRGAIVVLASASPFQNRDLYEGGAVVFTRLVRAFAPSGPVIFDEHHLGVGERRSFARYLREVGMLPVVLQVLVLAALALARAGARFGAPRSKIARPPAGTRSFLAAVGTLYEKAGDPKAASAVLVRHALSRIAAHHHIETVEPGHLVDALEQKTRKDEAAAVRELIAVSADRKRDLVLVARRIDALVMRATADAK